MIAMPLCKKLPWHGESTTLQRYRVKHAFGP